MRQRGYIWTEDKELGKMAHVSSTGVVPLEATGWQSILPINRHCYFKHM